MSLACLAEETVSAEAWLRSSCGTEAGWGPGSLGAGSRELGSPGRYVRVDTNELIYKRQTDSQT